MNGPEKRRAMGLTPDGINISSISIAAWLAAHGLGKHADRVVEQKIDVELLAHLTEADLNELGLPIRLRGRLTLANATLTESSAETCCQPSPPILFHQGARPQQRRTSDAS